MGPRDWKEWVGMIVFGGLALVISYYSNIYVDADPIIHDVSGPQLQRAQHK